MGRSKLERFQDNAESHNLLEPGKEKFLLMKGQWHKHFGNENDIVLELGCGRGEYTIGLSQFYPDRNFIGIDLKGARLWKGSSVAKELDINNVAFLRTQIQTLENFFEKGEVKEIWITFPDPRPRDREERLRITSLKFWNIYRKIMIDGGVVNFKTDNLELFNYTLDVLKDPALKAQNLVYTHDLYNSEFISLHHGIQTAFEKKFLAKQMKINYLKFNF